MEIIDHSNTTKFYNKKNYTDKLKDIKNILTDFITNEIIRTPDNIYIILKTFLQNINEEIVKYCELKNIPNQDILVLFKGGNILKIIQKEFTIELPNYASEALIAAFQNDFKRSDLDFSIYVHPKVPNFLKVVNDLTDIAYQFLSVFRNNILSSLTSYFEFFKYTLEFQHDFVSKYFNKINELPCFNDTSSPLYDSEPVQLLLNDLKYPYSYEEDFDYMGTTDKLINFENNENYINLTNKGEKTMIYVSNNKALKFKKNDENREISFNLVRAKIHFNLITKHKNKHKSHGISGELIDISLPKDNSNTHLFNNLKLYIARFTYNPNSETQLSLFAYSIDGIIYDLEQMLITYTLTPWDTEKYQKRLHRLMYMYFVHFFTRTSNKYSNSSKKHYYTICSELILPCAIDCLTTNTSKFNDMSFINYLNKLNQFYSDVRMNTLILKIKQMLETKFDQSNKDKFIEFIRYIKSTIAKFIQALDYLIEYDTKLKFNPPEYQLYTFDIDYSII